LLDDDYQELVFELSNGEYDSFDTTNASAYREEDIQVLEGLEAVRRRRVCISVIRVCVACIIWFTKLLRILSTRLWLAVQHH
jgi:hypothetical protein